MPATTIIGVVVSIPLLLGLYWLVSYNGFIIRRNKARHAFSTIDVQLKKRWDLIPQLVSTAKGYAVHEQTLFTSITKARAEAQQANAPTTRFQHEALIQHNAAQILSLSEAYPELKADKQFELLQRNLTEIEAQIAASRRSYNASVTAYNTALETAPSNIIAGFHRFTPLDLFSTKITERENIHISSL